MSDPYDRLTLQFLDWVARQPRAYDEAMEAWRSTCPRLTVWEDALLAGLVRVERDGVGRGATVALTPRGREALGERCATAVSDRTGSSGHHQKT